MKDQKFNLYKEAAKKRIITQKDYIRVYQNKILSMEGKPLDFNPVYHDINHNKLVGYFIPEGYKSIRVHFSMNMGVNSLSRLYNKICFDIGFLNSDKRFNEVFNFCNLTASYMFSNNKLIPKKKLTEIILTKGMETTEKNYSHSKARKYYFTDQSISGEDRKRIALINMNKNRSKTNREKVEEAIEYFIHGDEYILQRSIAKFLNVSLSTVRMNMTPQDKQRIADRNFELTGCPTINEYTRCQNIDKITEAYIKLKEKKQNINILNLSKISGIHRVTVSKIIQNEKDIFEGL